MNAVARRWTLGDAGRALVAILLVLFILLPLSYMILISLTPNGQIEAPEFWPRMLAWSNYVQMWQTINLARDLENSVIMSTGSGALATVLAAGAAYVLARFRFHGRSLFVYGLIMVQTVPSVMLLLPLFVVIVTIQNLLNVILVGQYYTVILTYMTFALPFATWLLLSYFGNIPLDLEEAALVDGATRYQVLTRVVLPLLLPGLVVAFVFSFLLAWSDVLFASVLTVENTRTLAVGLQAYTAAGESGAPVYWGQLMAASLMSEVPIVAIFLVVQRYIVSGLTGGAVKG
jgi:ABC-type glycerol-3-phosphate transport system permease component